MPSQAGLGLASRSLVTGGFGLQLVAPTSATRHLPRIDQVDGRYLSTDGTKPPGRQAFRVGRFPGRGLHEGHAAAKAMGGDVVSVGSRRESMLDERSGLPACCGRLVDNTSIRLAALDRRRILAASEEAVAIHREFAVRWPDAHLHELEQSLRVVAPLEPRRRRQ
jgi:hypothetical protein